MPPPIPFLAPLAELFVNVSEVLDTTPPASLFSAPPIPPVDAVAELLVNTLLELDTDPVLSL